MFEGRQPVDAAREVEDQPQDEVTALRNKVGELEKRLAGNEERLGLLLEHAPDAVYLHDLRGVFVEANKAAETLIGYPREELLGKSLLKVGLLSARSIPKAARFLALNALGHATGPDHFRLVRKDGTRVVVEVRSYPVNLPDGVVVMGIARDVTSREAQESALRESEEQLRAIVESAADAVVTADHRGRIRVWNAAARRLFGYNEDEVLGKSMEILVSDKLRGRDNSAIGRIIAGRGGPLLGQSFEVEALHKDGSELPIEVSVSVWHHGRRPRFTAIMRDISQRKAAEGALELERAYFEELFHSSPEAIVLVDNSSRILRQNDEFSRMFGYGPEETNGRLLDDLIAHDDHREEAVTLTQRVASGENIQMEVVRKTRSGRSLDVSILAAPVSTVEGHVAVLAIYRDVTEEKRAAELVRELQKLDSLSVMAGGIAHDFNNLLVSVLGNAELVLMDLGEEDPTRELVEAIQRAAQRASELTNQMLAYSGKGKFHVMPLDVSQLIMEMKKWLKTGGNTDAEVRFDLADDLPHFDGDAAQIRQAVSALFTNAVESLEGNPGSIVVSTGVETVDRSMLTTAHLADDLSEGEYVYVRVADSGGGMDDATKKRVFDPFFTTRFTGRGLGLPATFGIVRGHNGTIHLQTEVGVGTTVTALFPIKSKREEAEEKRSERPVERWRGSGTVLVVDDEDSVRSVAQAVLEKWGFTVLEAADGLEAVEVFDLHADAICAVLLDFTMPQMNGDEAFAEIHRRRPDVPVILMSGYAEEDTVSESTERCLAGFLHKPFQPTKLLEKLRGVLER